VEVARIGNQRTVGRVANLAHHRAKLDKVTDALGEGVDDSVHTAHRLQHRRLLVEAFVEVVPPRRRIEISGEGQRLVEDASTETGVGLVGEAAAGRAVVRVVGAEIADRLEPHQKLFLVFGAELGVECALLRAFGEQLGDIAARVGVSLPLAHGHTVECGLVKKSRAAVVDEGLERYAKTFAVPEQGAVVVGDARRTGIQIEVGGALEGTRLRAIRLGQDIAPADGQASPAGPLGGLENDAVEPCARKLVSGSHSRQARSEDHHLAAAGREVCAGDLELVLKTCFDTAAVDRASGEPEHRHRVICGSASAHGT
jgi:hypothetical protein